MIDSYSFGNITINGQSYEDIKIHKKKVTTWHYIEHHTVTAQDIAEILDDTEYLVIGTGSSGLVTVKQEVYDICKEKSIEVIEAKTKDACEKYNELEKQKKKVAAIIHSTC